jgi:hypothetical protein
MQIALTTNTENQQICGLKTYINSTLIYKCAFNIHITLVLTISAMSFVAEITYISAEATNVQV